MRKALILTAAAALGLCGGLYLALSGDTSGQAVLSEERVAELEELRGETMFKLRFAGDRGSEVGFIGEDGSEMSLAAYEGQYVVLNFWATWCAPCRVEMPHLSDLQAELGGEDFQVVTIATGTNPRPAMDRFFDEIGVDNLPLHRDPNTALSRDFGVLGLPVTLILDPEGHEIARLTGDADWASDEAKAIIRALIEG